MKISVIIPAHNEELYIADALRALLAQTHQDFEVVVIDNGSTDRTMDIVRDFPVSLLSESRKGTMWACEAGRQKASGEIIVRMDADCIPDTTWLEKGEKHFDNTHVVAVSGYYIYYDAPPLFRCIANLIQRYQYPVVHAILQAIHVGGVMVGGNTFMRASTLEKAGGFDTSIVFYGDDTDVAKRMSSFGKVVFDRNLPVKSSARRFKKQGTMNIIMEYAKGFFGTLSDGRAR